MVTYDQLSSERSAFGSVDLEFRVEDRALAVAEPTAQNPTSNSASSLR